jgi:hypothetical protein
MNPLLPHIIYSKYTLPELKELIRKAASTRKTPSAGKDLQEMRLEYRRRTFRPKVNGPKVDKRSFCKSDTPEDFANRKRTKVDLMAEELPPSTTLYPKVRAKGCLNARQEKFAEVFAITQDYVKAWRASGYKQWPSDSLTRLKGQSFFHKSKKVQQRVADLKEEALRRMAWNKEKVLDKMGAIYEEAMSGDNTDLTNANRSMEAIARHLGMFVDKSESKVSMVSSGENDSDEKVTADIGKLADMVGLKVVNGGKE